MIPYITLTVLLCVLAFVFANEAVTRIRHVVRQRGPRRQISVEYFRIRADQVQAIASIETVPLRRRLEREDGMDPIAAELAVSEYLAFLAIAAANSGWTIAPVSDACDLAWHAHILHTEAYDRDMRAIFGRPFHHRPAEEANDAWLAEPQRRTEVALDNFSGISSWSGLAAAQAQRRIPASLIPSTAAILGMALASGPKGFETVASMYRTVRIGARAADTGSPVCGGGGADGHSSGGHSCGGSSCSGH